MISKPLPLAGVSFWKFDCPFVDLSDEKHGDGERSTDLLNGADLLMQASISSSLQIALAAVLALATAQALQLPDAYWAPISAIVCSLEAFDRAFETARRRLIGTLLGVGLAAVQVSFVQQSLLTYGLCIGLLGWLCYAARLHPSSLRFGAIAFTVVVTEADQAAIWLTAATRFIDVALGILVALLVIQYWPGRSKS